MKRFLFIVMLILTGSVVCSTKVDAEERLIAVVLANSQPRHLEIQSVFEQNSQEFCGSDCRIYVQTPNTDTMSLRNSVRKAVALGAELIITYGSPATLAAKAEVPPVPVLFVDIYDPVKLGLVDAGTGVGRNMTGVQGDAPVQALLKYFLEATSAGSLVVLYDTNSPDAQLQKNILEQSGKRRGITVTSLGVEGSSDHLPKLAVSPADADGLFLANSDHVGSQLEEVLAFASERGVPVITQRPGVADLGALMTLESSAEEQGLKLAEIAAKLLSGTSVMDLPFHKPHQVSLVVNLKTAKTLGLKVPFSTLSVASRVVR